MDEQTYRKAVGTLSRHQAGRCPVCGGTLYDGGKIDYHHVVHNTLVNRKLYPRLVAHPTLAKALLHADCHMANPSWGKRNWPGKKCVWYEMRLSRQS